MGPIGSVHKVDHDCQKDLSDLQLCCFPPLQASNPFQKKQSTYAPPTMTGKHWLWDFFYKRLKTSQVGHEKMWFRAKFWPNEQKQWGSIVCWWSNGNNTDVSHFRKVPKENELQSVYVQVNWSFWLLTGRWSINIMLSFLDLCFFLLPLVFPVRFLQNQHLSGRKHELFMSWWNQATVLPDNL